MSVTTFDRTARKAHQWTMVALAVLAFVFQGSVGAALLAIAGIIMLGGRFWWPADVVRQFVWRVLEPAGILKRADVAEDHETRRVARIIGGAVWLASAVLLLDGFSLPANVLSLLIAAMVALDASVNFCALCFLVAQVQQRRAA